jgi:endonuclease/exonuclease/phosphatase family metal-dependent hydrolase
VRDNFADLDDVKRILAGPYRVLFSDVAGNDERMAFVYDSNRVTLLEKIGEIAIPPSQLKNVKLPGVTQKFGGFDRNPYLAAFQTSAQNSFLLVNVHLYYGSDSDKKDIQRRALETFAVARWADQRLNSPYSFTREIIALGDFNMPKRDPTDPVFKALTSKGLKLPDHTSEVGSNLASDKHYDQIAFFPGHTEDCFRQMGVFDYDNVIFKTLYQSRPLKDFRGYLRYYLSDHRPLWMELAA